MFGNWYHTKKSWAELTLAKKSYDPFIDFLKGTCIIFVILNHCMPTKIMEYTGFMYWGVSAVPIFLIIQVFHAYKKERNSICTNYNKIWNKIVWPFLICEIIICMVFIIRLHHTESSAIISDIVDWIKSGGYGPGAYYPWVYIQFAILLPLISPIFKISEPFQCLIFIIVSQFVEASCAFFNLPQLAYRLLFFRYIFIFYLGHLLAKKGYQLNILTFCAGIICLVLSAIIVYRIFSIPFLFVFVNPVCHWFCYVYIAFILLFLLKHIYNNLPNGIFKNYLLNSGKYSYEIFLFQIVYFAIADDFIIESIALMNINNYVFYSIKICIPVIICTLPVILYKNIIKSTAI